MRELRGPQYEMNPELEELKNILKLQEYFESGVCSKLNELRSRTTLLPVLMMTVLMMLQVLTGNETVSYYSLDIFKRANVSMNNHILAILVCGGCTIGYAISAFLMSRVRRKIHFIVSGVVMAIFVLTLGFALKGEVTLF